MPQLYTTLPVRSLQLNFSEMRVFETFQYRDAVYRMCGERTDVMRASIVSLRDELDAYVSLHHSFQESFTPVDCFAGAPDSAREMASASLLYEIGPMAAVAGTFAEYACRAAIAAGASEAVIDNGGDCFFFTKKPLTVALFAADSSVSGKIGFTVPAGSRYSICSSSSRMGHSKSFGNCSLVTIIADTGAVADAAATYYCNSVKSDGDISKVISWAQGDKNINGALIIDREQVALCGAFPPLVKINVPDVKSLIAAHPLSGVRFY